MAAPPNVPHPRGNGSNAKAVDRLFGAAKTFIGNRRELEAEPFKRLLDGWGTERVELPPTTLPVLESLDGTLANSCAATVDLVELLVRDSAHLNWRQTYDDSDPAGAKLLERYGWTELVGNKGPLISRRLRLGFVIWGPNTFYPPHAHLAEELYVVLSGTGEWARGDEGERMRCPGDVFLHSPQMFHSTRSFAEPVLAMYLWRGAEDLLEKPHFRG
ncbi:Dimethlysulfonioproprionate lyase [Rhizobiales bacterium GAS191]|nr:Dimethlysulfonioproprionate lyase [Rhizobiales bacterium GAS113]SED81696.1 Dimethlysulfonioproprionate lyase [Rhizobiales bacterium GAS191]